MNIGNWMYFAIGIKSFIPHRRIFKRKLKRITDYCLIPIILFTIILFFIGFTLRWTIINNEKIEKEDKHEKSKYHSISLYFNYMISAVFFALAIGFIVVGQWLRSEIRNLNEDLERQVRGKFIYATWVLSVPFLIRAIYNIFSAVLNLDSVVIKNSIEENSWVAPLLFLFYITVADLFPITSQLVSMFVINDDVDDSRSKCFGLKSEDTTEENLNIWEVDRLSSLSKTKQGQQQSTPPYLNSNLLPELIEK